MQVVDEFHNDLPPLFPLYSCDFGTSVRYAMSVSILHDFDYICQITSYICLMILVHLYAVSLLCLYSIIIFYLNRKKCTEGHLPCTNGIVLIQKAGMKRCGCHPAPGSHRTALTAFRPHLFPQHFSPPFTAAA